MSSRLAAVEFWDREIGLWVKGNHRLHPDLERWRATYSGRGAGTVDMTVMPEPYIGSLAGSATPALVMLGLNPGAPAPAFQSMDGIYTQRVRETSYSNWASSGPYTDATWQQAHGRNRYHHNRLAFARRLHNDDTIQNHDLLYIELYPFHSKAVTAAITPPADLLTRFILDPISELETPFVFAFGKPWLRAASRLGLSDGNQLPVNWATASRTAHMFPLIRNQRLVVITQAGYAGPPGATDTEALAAALHSQA
ncbi:anti-phage DNA glycosylase Brig1 [Tessaracoccus defluvii]|uniref:anti-phage DNA glycosylase Brig1 n=1 Tax=Tessaracoccus defluvii TaxID=1285901 RepID=UPI0031D3CA27